MKKVITIGRQFGSGGSEIAKKLAERMNLNYYDKNLIELASEKSGINQKFFEQADEKHNSFLYSLSMAHYGGLVSPVYLNDVITNDKLFIIQSNLIKEIASKEDAIIVGRCASEILAKEENVLSLYIHAPIDIRIERIAKLYDMSTKSAETLIKRTDKSRSSYFNFYSSKNWGAADSYDLSIDSSVLGIDKTVDLLEEYIKHKYN